MLRKKKGVCINAYFALSNSFHIYFYMPKDRIVSNKIYNILRKEIEILADQYFSNGYYTIPWNPQQTGKGLAGEVYF